jgi:hypothetical protein
MSERSISLKIIVTAAASVFVFIASIIASIVIGSGYGQLKGQFEEIYNQEKALEKEIFNQNNAYYAEMLKNGFSDIPGGKEAVAKAVRQFYGYRLKLDGKLVNQVGYGLNKKSCVITIEEYYLTYATNYLPESVLNYFKYLNNKGVGGDKTPDESIYQDILQGTDLSVTVTGCEKKVERHDEGNTTVINIEITQMVAGSSDIYIKFSSNFLRKFNLTDDFLTGINIWTVIE